MKNFSEIKKRLSMSSTLPAGSAGSGAYMMGSAAHSHEHAADGSCCGHDHSHDHGHSHNHSHHHDHSGGCCGHDHDDEDDVTNPSGGCC